MVSFVPKARGYFESCESILNILYPSHVLKSINGLALRLLGRNLDLWAKNILVNLQFFVQVATTRENSYSQDLIILDDLLYSKSLVDLKGVH